MKKYEKHAFAAFFKSECSSNHLLKYFRVFFSWNVYQQNVRKHH